MAIAEIEDILTTALWPQRDARDPLGVWGGRHGLTGDASGNPIKTTFQAPAGQAAAYIYTCYAAIFAQLTGTVTLGNIKTRLLTNWPNVDLIAGVQAFATLLFVNLEGSIPTHTPPGAGPNDAMVRANDRFLLLFDPRPSGGAMDIVEIEFAINTNLATYSFEVYGYYWDRQILNTPGGPRHPGSS